VKSSTSWWSVQNSQASTCGPSSPPNPGRASAKSDGSHGSICAIIFSPRELPKTGYRVDDILDEVALLRPRRKPLHSRKLLLTLASLAVVAGLGIGEYFPLREPMAQPLRRLHRMAGPLNEHLARETPKEISSDQYLQDHLVHPLAEARTAMSN